MNWRPIKTAPKNFYILIKYPSFCDGEPPIVGMGLWVDVPHNNAVMEHIAKGKKELIPKAPHDPHWETSYTAILQHGGAWDGLTYETRGCRVEPTHWQPLPKA